MNTDYLYIHHARFSNNTNTDGQSFHRDIKPPLFYQKEYPHVYTIILYLDTAGISIGNKQVMTSAGDVVIFNAFQLHKAIGIEPFSQKKQRRVLQLFDCIFDEKVKEDFLERTRFCSHYGNPYLHLSCYFLDTRWLFEYMNCTHFFYTVCDKENENMEFTVSINDTKYMTTIDGIKYYSDF